MKFSHSFIIFSMIISYEVKSCEIKNNILTCKNSLPETHNCTENNINDEILSLTHKYTCSKRTSPQQQSEGSRFKVKSIALSWIPQTLDLSSPNTNRILSKECEPPIESQLKCHNITIYKCDGTNLNQEITPNETIKYKCTQTRFIVNSQKKYTWKLVTDDQAPSPPPSPTSSIDLEESLEKLERAILEVRNNLERRKASR